MTPIFWLFVALGIFMSLDAYYINREKKLRLRIEELEEVKNELKDRLGNETTWDDLPLGAEYKVHGHSNLKWAVQIVPVKGNQLVWQPKWVKAHYIDSVGSVGRLIRIAKGDRGHNVPEFFEPSQNPT